MSHDPEAATITLRPRSTARPGDPSEVTPPDELGDVLDVEVTPDGLITLRDMADYKIVSRFIKT